MYDLPDLTGLFVFAAIGLAVTALLALGGVGWLIWFAIHHVQII